MTATKKPQTATGADDVGFGTIAINVRGRASWRPERKDSQAHWPAAKVAFVDVHIRKFQQWVLERENK